MYLCMYGKRRYIYCQVEQFACKMILGRWLDDNYNCDMGGAKMMKNMMMLINYCNNILYNNVMGCFCF